MPDLMTHLAAGYVASLSFWRQRSLRVLFYLGTILPDLLTRPFYMVLGRYWHDAGLAVAPLHTPVGYALACVLVAQCFDRRQLQRVALAALLAGGGLHLLMDGLQRHVVGSYHWLFPFSWWTYEWGLFWPEASVRWLPVSFGLIVVIESLAWFIQRRGGAMSGRQRPPSKENA